MERQEHAAQEGISWSIPCLTIIDNKQTAGNNFNS